MGFFDRLFGGGRGQPEGEALQQVRAEPQVERKDSAEARVAQPASVPPGVDAELLARMKAYADEVAAMDPVEVARTDLGEIREIRERDLDRAPDLRVDEARFVATYVCWKPSVLFDEPEVTAIYREVRECARDIARRWRRARGRVLPDNRFDSLESSMTKAERAEHQSATAEDCELVTRGMLAVAQLALLPADALESRGGVDEEDDE